MTSDTPTAGLSTRPLAPVVPLFARRRMFRAWTTLPSLERVGTRDYYLLGAGTMFLAAFGLLMVLSASSVEAGQADGNPFANFSTQALAEFVGLALMLLGSRARPEFWRRIAPIAFVASILLQLATALTPLGHAVNGNQNWLLLPGGVSVQPSEFVKFALVLVMATFFSRQRPARLGLRGLAPVGVLTAVAIGAVYAGHDLGTCLIIAMMALGGLFFAGVRVRVLALVIALLVPFAILASVIRGSRVDRIGAWTSGCGNDVLGTCWQSTQATWALAAGGVFGKGLGNSVSKWFWLPEADNDFILAIIGEETGLIGLLVLLVLFVALTIAFLRITATSRDPFTLAATGMVLAWIIGQAMANIAVVLGFAPVFGVPLPFISSGGSSMVANLIAIGCIMSLANVRPATPASAGAQPFRPLRSGLP